MGMGEEEGGYLHGRLDVSSIQVVGITGLSDQTSSDIISKGIGLRGVARNGAGGSVDGSLFVGLVSDHMDGSIIDGLIQPFGVAGANVDALVECGLGFFTSVVAGRVGCHTAVVEVGVVLVVQRLSGSGAGETGTMGAVGTLSVGSGRWGNVTATGDASSGRVDGSGGCAGDGSTGVGADVAGVCASSACGYAGVRTSGSSVCASVCACGASVCTGSACGVSTGGVGDVGVTMMMVVIGAVSAVGMVLAGDLTDDGGSLLLNGLDSRGLVGRDVVVVGRGGGVVSHVG